MDEDVAADEAVSRRSDGSTRNELMMGHVACGKAGQRQLSVQLGSG